MRARARAWLELGVLFVFAAIFNLTRKKIVSLKQDFFKIYFLNRTYLNIRFVLTERKFMCQILR